MTPFHALYGRDPPTILTYVEGFSTNLQVDREMQDFKAFTTEVQAMTEIKHRNIVKMYGFCSDPRYCFLIYQFL